MKKLNKLIKEVENLENGFKVSKDILLIKLIECKEELTEQLAICGVVNCVYVVTERDNYGEQLFKEVFAKREQAVEYLAKQGLKEGNVDEITEIELD